MAKELKKLSLGFSVGNYFIQGVHGFPIGQAKIYKTIYSLSKKWVECSEKVLVGAMVGPYNYAFSQEYNFLDFGHFPWFPFCINICPVFCCLLPCMGKPSR